MAENNVDAGTPTEPVQTNLDSALQSETAPVDSSTAMNQEPVAQSNEPTFMDPASIPDELLPAYKSMQGQWTRKMQDISNQRQKVEAYDQFLANPQATIRNLAGQYGIELQKAQEQVAPESQENYEPKSWEEVLSRAEQRAESRVLETLKPVLDPMLAELKSVKKSETERKLDSEWAEWRQYENEMIDVLKKHPTLANDPTLLAMVATPKEVRDSKMYKKALDTMNSKKQSAKVATTGGAKAQNTTNARATSFSEAIANAKRQLGWNSG